MFKESADILLLMRKTTTKQNNTLPQMIYVVKTRTLKTLQILPINFGFFMTYIVGLL